MSEEPVAPAQPLANFQYEIYAGGLAGETPALPVSGTELQERARELLSPQAYGYVAGGAGTELTMRTNLPAFERLEIVPRMLRDVSERDLSTSVLGTAMPAPLMLAPVGVQSIVHPEGELAVARAAAAHGLPYILSTAASHGRQVDGAIGALDALGAVGDAVGGDLAVLFDSGIRTGADVVKALALGADAVCLGRPYIWGLALGGQAGVEQVLRGLLAELDLTLALSGYTAVAQVDRDALRPTA
jgi:isopentenyl diphosphate isomerase/L-lactate dehydrogenase-like FMN-dependent dehydrogenase